MRSDGTVTFYFIQHLSLAPEPRWGASDLSVFLFRGLTYQQANGPLGDHFRRLLEPQSASSALWQKYGINGFEEEEDAQTVLRELRHRPGTRRQFRLARRTITQTTEVVA